ncbi:MAG: aminoacyl-tRNA hydrolase [Candidatus Omnitrophota bacterium]
MKLIIGLGNPGRIYADTRHNIGFLILEKLARNKNIKLKKESGLCFSEGKGRIENESAVLIKPYTFMNLSGIAVKQAVVKHKADGQDILIICDDLDLDFGRIKIRPSGSSAGHRGIESIISSLNNNTFNRLRIGIGRPDKNIEPAEYVLSVFSKEEKKILDSIIDSALECIEAWISKGIDKAMDIYNKRS